VTIFQDQFFFAEQSFFRKILCTVYKMSSHRGYARSRSASPRPRSRRIHSRDDSEHEHRRSRKEKKHKKNHKHRSDTDSEDSSRKQPKGFKCVLVFISLKYL
jgi:hypothetical protein